jgi:hypothetical protein
MAAAVAVLGSGFLASAAHAAPAGQATGGTSAVASHSPAVPTGSTAKEYWTPERMRAAKPVPAPATKADTVAAAPTGPQGPAGQVAPARPVKGPGAVPAAANPLADPGANAAAWGGNFWAPPATTSGKVFFTGADGNPYVCSGSTVNSNGKNLVYTAGHCVNDGAGHWYNLAPWKFVPDYSFGYEPFGEWFANQLWALNGWLNGGDRTQDIGVAIMATNSGTHIVDAVGGQGIEWNFPLVQYMFQFGYPQRSPFDGNSLQYCTGNTYNDGGNEGINCSMTEGASGGPWLARFDGTFGYLDSVNSWVFWNSAGVRFKWNGPYFGTNAGNFFNQVANL